MKESFWGYMILVLGVLAIITIYFFQTVTNINEHNYTLLKETTEGAMIDALDLATYRKTGEVRIDQEKFVENFIRRFASGVQLAKDYRIEIYDVNEQPPKVSIKVSSSSNNNFTFDLFDFSIQNKLDAILEEPANRPYETGSRPESVPYEAVPSRLESDDISDILDTSDNEFLTTEKCEMKLGSYTGSSTIGKSYTINVSGSHYGTISCSSANKSIADCTVSGSTITVIPKDEGSVNLLIKGTGETVNGKKYKCSSMNYVVNVVAYTYTCPDGGTLKQESNGTYICVKSAERHDSTTSACISREWSQSDIDSMNAECDDRLEKCLAKVRGTTANAENFGTSSASSLGLALSESGCRILYNACSATVRNTIENTKPPCQQRTYLITSYECDSSSGWRDYGTSQGYWDSNRKCYKYAVLSNAKSTSGSSSSKCPNGYKSTSSGCVKCTINEIHNNKCK